MIRHSEKSDIPSLLALAELSELFPPDQLNVLKEMLTEYFYDEDEQDCFWLTDDEGGEAKGMVYGEPELMTNGTWNLRLIAVLPELQGLGRGRALLEHTESLLAEHGARLLIVDTSGVEEFAPVREFYKKCGYTEEARLKNFFDDGDDKVTFTKALG